MIVKEMFLKAYLTASSGITFAAALFRVVLPESEVFLRARREEKARGEVTSGAAKSKAFLVSAKDALKQYWARCIFAVVLMSFFNFFSSVFTNFQLVNTCC